MRAKQSGALHLFVLIALLGSALLLALIVILVLDRALQSSTAAMAAKDRNAISAAKRQAEITGQKGENQYDNNDRVLTVDELNELIKEQKALSAANYQQRNQQENTSKSDLSENPTVSASKPQ